MQGGKGGGGNQVTHVRENTVPYGLVCHHVAGGFGRQGGGNYSHRWGWGTTRVAAQPVMGVKRDGFHTAPFCTADVDSQDPDSTNLLENEPPRDYFLKCK